MKPTLLEKLYRVVSFSSLKFRREHHEPTASLEQTFGEHHPLYDVSYDTRISTGRLLCPTENPQRRSAKLEYMKNSELVKTNLIRWNLKDKTKTPYPQTKYTRQGLWSN